ncbi:helix-turn-helix domain-containing protein [Roseateles sp. SL47]|uniref:helix-turn-helix domain-containing protein n=1 Tax=Roseateles sp. SL47 TaxID=2995138 RepID=UPI002270BE96|nr:helix-turn-helix domain-containing protein [Roseateles sp. SL47]WAC71966.1 helix-turn-helix domain-containing protein [Roseateles sp. SL47]
MAERDEIKSLKKALSAIAYMNEYGDVTVTQVAKGVGVPRATAYRLLQTLASEGYVDKLPNSDIYRLTSLVRRLSAGFRDEQMLIEIARPLIVQAQQELGWSIALATPRGTDMVVRLNTDHDSPLALIRYGVGASLPMLLSTCGYCYLAHCRPEDRQALINEALSRVDPVQPVRFDRDQIQRLIADVLTDGYCHLEFDHYREGNLGVPLLLAGQPVGGIVMRYIKSTLRNTDKLRNAYAPRLQQIAREIAARHPAHRTWQASIQSVNTAPHSPS